MPAALACLGLAATLAGMAFSNVGVAVVHALEYPIGGATHCSHGAGNGLLLLALLFGLVFIVRPSALKRLEAWADRSISARKSTWSPARLVAGRIGPR